ncbi:class I SAM-dependent methyltransferase [Candidatus Parcubacteria bacterium]|nr:class I SAM-dependent methyltransferase [Candidatus Parcubacteria bacterium]
MIKKILAKIINKLIIGPRRYGRKNDYDAERYWQDRFDKYGDSIVGVGNEGLDEKSNQEVYKATARQFERIIKDKKINLSEARILDAGCGNGFYTDLLLTQGAVNYQGVDITDALFPKLVKSFPKFKFTKLDISSENISKNINKKFDLVICIDVIEHIVNQDKFDFAIKNLLGSLAPGGILMLSPVMEKSKKRLFYLRSWSRSDIVPLLGDNFQYELKPYRGKEMMIIKKVLN